MRGLLSVALLILALGPAQATTIVGAAGKSLDDAVLIGSGGEIYRRGETSYRRTAGGGVAPTVRGAMGTSGSEVFVIGRFKPAYRFDGTIWNAMPILEAKGEASLCTGGVPAIALGTRVYVLVGGVWKGLPKARAKDITAVWASGPKRAVIASGREVHRFQGGWRVLRPAFADGERVAALFDGPASTVVAAGDQGSLFEIGVGAKKIAREPRLQSFRALVGASGAGPRLYLVGRAQVDGQEQTALVKLEGSRLVVVDAVPVGTETPSAMLVLRGGVILVATAEGTVHLRSDGVWTSLKIDFGAPAEEKHKANPPARVP